MRGGVGADLGVAIGESQSAIYLTTYVNAVDRRAQVFDAFLVHGRGARGASLDGSGMTSDGAAECIRADALAPVLVLQSETDVVLLEGGRVPQEDGPKVRLWEVAGSAHGDSYVMSASASDDGTRSPEELADLLRAPAAELRTSAGEVIGSVERPINSGPQQHYVSQAGYEHLVRWAAGGDAPSVAPRLERDGDDLARDELGISCGGVRTPWVDVPAAVLSGLGQSGDGSGRLFGTTTPITPEVLAARYPGGVDDYTKQFEAALDEVIDAGFLLADDRDEMIAVAHASYRA